MPKGRESNRQHGSAVQHCPLVKGSILVQVFDWETGNAVAGVDVKLLPTGASGKTGGSLGLKQFKNLETGPYDVQIDIGQLAAKFSIDKSEEQEEVVGGEEGVCVFWLKPLGSLKVKVVCIDKNSEGQDVTTVLDGVEIEIKGPDEKQGKTTGGSGWFPFSKIKSGAYQANIVSLGGHAKHYEAEGDGETVELSPGGQRELILKVVPSGWIEFLVVEANTDPVKPVPEITIQAKHPATTMPPMLTTDNGLARVGKLKSGSVDIETMSSTSQAWEFVSIS